MYITRTMKDQSLSWRTTDDEEIASPSTKDILDKVWHTCGDFQRNMEKTHQFYVFMSIGNLVLHGMAGMDLSKAGGRTFLHTVDRDTKFATALILAKQTARKEWEALLLSFMAKDVVFPYYVTLDKLHSFRALYAVRPCCCRHRSQNVLV